MLRVEDKCNVVTGETLTCMIDAGSDNVSGLPILKEMTDNGDGTYTATYSFSGSSGIDLVVSAEFVGESGIWVEYYNNKEGTGTPELARWENSDMDYDWGTGNVTPSTGSDVLVRWWSKLIPLYSETFTFDIEHDPAFALYIDDVLKTDSWYYSGPQTS